MDNIWIGISHVFLPTFWCPKCEKWTSHPESYHEEHTRWQTMKDAQMAKQEENRKQNPYGPHYHRNRSYFRNDNNKRSSTSYDRKQNHDKQSRNERG
jgi:hypothetical protein